MGLDRINSWSLPFYLLSQYTDKSTQVERHCEEAVRCLSQIGRHGVRNLNKSTCLHGIRKVVQICKTVAMLL